MRKIKYLGVDPLVLDTITLTQNDEFLFHAVIFTEKDLGVIINKLSSGDIELYKDDVLVIDYIKEFNTVLNSTTTRGQGIPTSIQSWYKFGETIGYDYKYVRQQVILLAVGIAGVDYSDWLSIPSLDRQVVCELVGAPVALIESEVGVPQSQLFLKAWAKASTTNRTERWEKSKSYIFKVLEEGDAKSMLGELTTGVDYVTRYYGGIEGTLEDQGVEGVYDYVDARLGTSFALTGLRKKGFVPKDGLTMDEVADRVLEILQTGL